MALNTLYLGPSVVVSASNRLGNAALNALHGSPSLGHEQKIRLQDYGTLWVAYILLNEETVGFVVYDEDQGDYVHHQFIGSRIERCLLAHATDIAPEFLNALPNNDPELLLTTTLVYLSASQQLHRKIKQVRASTTPVYALRAHVGDTVHLAKIPKSLNTPEHRASIEQSSTFMGWLNDKTDAEITRLIDGCTLADRPSHLHVAFTTPNRIGVDNLKRLDRVDELLDDALAMYQSTYNISDSTDALKQWIDSSPAIKSALDKAALHDTPVANVARMLDQHAQQRFELWP